MTTARRVGLHLSAGALAGTLSVCYLGAMFLSLYGPFGGIWLFVVLAIPVVCLGVGSTWHWNRPTVIAFIGLGVVAAFVGLHGDGSSGLALGRTYGPDAFYTYAYDWQTNTLHHGMTNPGDRPLINTKPNRGSLAVGATSLALGIYGMFPDRWLPSSKNPTRSSRQNPVR